MAVPHGARHARELAAPLDDSSGDGICEGAAARPTVGGPGAALADQFNYVAPEVRPLPRLARFIRLKLFKIFLIVVFGTTLIALFVMYFVQNDHDTSLLFIPCSSKWKDLVKYLSIPLVSVFFTWWHVWLGIQMCFYPVKFIGCCPPVLGWQGIVPRRAHVMASRSCDIMIGSLFTIEEIISRIEPEDFFDQLEPVLAATSAAVLGRISVRHWPAMWERLPDSVKQELQSKVLDESHNMFHPVITDLKANIGQIIDVKQMAIDVLVGNKKLLVDMFHQVGHREFIFIQHVAAVMGFVLGVIQMFVWLALKGGTDDTYCMDRGHSHAFQCWGGFLILPLSGLVIGYFTNWLGITMIFRPVMPHIVCGGYINIQGVFLKRQQQVSLELSTMICTHLVHARKILEYAVQKPGIMDAILELYQKHMHVAFDHVMGRAQTVMPMLLGRAAIEGIKQEVIDEIIAELPHHSQEIEDYIDRAFALRDTLAYRLSRLPPSRFEGMLHPVFQEDEWMVLLLGGVLGVVVGTLQAFALGT